MVSSKWYFQARGKSLSFQPIIHEITVVKEQCLQHWWSHAFARHINHWTDILHYLKYTSLFMQPFKTISLNQSMYYVVLKKKTFQTFEKHLWLQTHYIPAWTISRSPEILRNVEVHLWFVIHHLGVLKYIKALDET